MGEKETKMKKILNNIIFDLGNVLFHWSPDEIYPLLALESGVDKKLFEQIGTTPIWQQFDRGLVTKEEVTQALIQFLPKLSSNDSSFIH